MGNNHSRCWKHRYNIKRKHDKVGITNDDTRSVGSTIDKFDSLKTHTPRSISTISNESKHSLPLNGNVITAYDNYIYDNNDKHKHVSIKSSVERTTSGFSVTTCDTISDASGEHNEHEDVREHMSKISEEEGFRDSDLGSDTLSMAYSSSKDDVENLYLRQFSNKGGDLESSGNSFTPIERPYNTSRLGRRQDSRTSTESQEVIYWKKGNRLGRGTFGTVYLGLNITGELIAVKQIELNTADFNEAEKEYEKIYREVSILRTLRHSNIVQYIGSSYDNGVINIFMQYAAGGSLQSIIERFGPLEEVIVANYTKQILSAVVFMHDNNVVHRDIKSANIMLTADGVIKLIDFGCARRLALRMSKSGSHLMHSLRGTPYWMAPEVINETGHGMKSDIWSVGCTLYEMLTCKPPWGDREPIAAIYAIGSDDMPIPGLSDSFSLEAREFASLCLIRDKHKRPKAKILKCHSFVSTPTTPQSEIHISPMLEAIKEIVSEPEYAM